MRSTQRPARSQMNLRRFDLRRAQDAPEMQAFHRDLQESVRQMRAGQAVCTRNPQSGGIEKHINIVYINIVLFTNKLQHSREVRHSRQT